MRVEGDKMIKIFKFKPRRKKGGTEEEEKV